MTLLHAVTHRPHGVWIRRALFQVHLWVGVTVALYVVVVGLSGSMLVFLTGLERLSYDGMTRAPIAKGQAIADPLTVLDGVRRACRDGRVETVYLPRSDDENFFTVVDGADETSRYVFSDALTGQVLGQTVLDDAWVGWLADLHINLLAGETGFIVNGVAAMSVLVMCVTGIMIWWRGLRSWRRGLGVSFHRRWRRLNFDLHSALGFWTFAFLLMWAASGVYFAWPDRVIALVNRMSPVSDSVGGVDASDRRGRPMVDLRRVIDETQASMPTTRLAGIALPIGDREPITLYMAREDKGNFAHMNYVYVDPWTGARLATWVRGANDSLGDWIISLMGPLHYGMYWGRTVQIIWAIAGLVLPVMAVTGLLMYWNRYLSRKWAMLRASSA